MIKKIWNKFSRSDEKGQALVMVLVLLIVGALIIAPLMANIGTGLLAGEVHEEKANELYAADAGVEDGLWQIKKNKLTDMFGDMFGAPPDPNGYYPYAYYDNNPSYEWNYDLTGAEQVNGMDVDITFRNIWIPLGIPAPTPAGAKAIVGVGKLMVIGDAIVGSNPPTYKITISYTKGVSDPTLNVTKIGVWLPPGFTYTTGSCNLTGSMTFSEAVIDHAGNKAVVWTFSSVPFTSFPGVDSSVSPMEFEITFRYSASQSGTSPDAVAWIKTSGVSDIPYAWNADLKIYQITSIAGDTTVQAYAIKSQLRQLLSSVAGDYHAIGNSLMTNEEPDGFGGPVRDTLWAESSATVNSIPPDAEVQVAYLYWSAWFEEGMMGKTIWQDKCRDINSQWSPGSRWTESSGEYRGQGSGTATQPQRTLTLTSSLDLSSYAGQTVIVTWEQRETGNLAASDYLYFAFSNDGGSTWSSNIVAFYDNDPATPFTYAIPQAYLTAQFKMRFYFTFNNTNKSVYLDNIRIAQVIFFDDCSSFATNGWTNGSQWTISSGEFQGRGSDTAPKRTLTLTNNLDLSSYYGGTVKVSWKQREWESSGNLESSDYLYFAFSKDGGTTWSSDIAWFVAFQDDISGGGPEDFTYTIPQEYLTAQFKMKFYLAFDDATEYADLNDIVIAEYLTYDDTAIFKIDGVQVYLDASGVPQAGNQELTADRSQVLVNESSYMPGTYFYACKKDVTDLILAFAEDDDGEVGNDGDESDDIYHPGNATYTVGGVDATEDADSEIAYAGWSLIIIYSSTATEGHMLYLFDEVFTTSGQNSNVDFDHDGQPGGTISGFLVPDPVAGDINVAHITCFVGEGDDYYPGDYVAFNAPSMPAANQYKLWDGITTGGNTQSSPNDVWNDKSLGMSADGVDVDTFYVPWGTPPSTGLLPPGAVSAHIDIWTGTDIWQLVYIIISFRSATTTGGAVTYLIIH